MSHTIKYFDLYDKYTDIEYTIQTLSSKIFSFLVTFFGIIILIFQYYSYQKPIIYRDLSVNNTFKNNAESINISLSVFVRMPCFFLHLDVLDSLGFTQLDVNKSVKFERIAKNGTSLGITKDSVTNICMSCKGLLPDSACCNSCEQIYMLLVMDNKEFNPKEWEQCDPNSPVSVDNEESCLVEGIIETNKVQGHFHIAPGKNLPSEKHDHDLSFQYPSLNIPHIINEIIIGHKSNLSHSTLIEKIKKIDGEEPIIHLYNLMITPITFIKNNKIIDQFYEYTFLESYYYYKGTHGHWPGIYFHFKFMPYNTVLYYISKNPLQLFSSSAGLLAGIFSLCTLIDSLLSRDWNVKVPQAFRNSQPILIEEKNLINNEINNLELNS